MTSKYRTTQVRLAAWAAAAALIISLLPARVNAAVPNNTFTFSDSGISASGSGSGYEINGTDLTINESGTYALTGSCGDGSVTVKKGTTGVTLVLNDLTLTSADTAPIACNKSTEVTIEAASGTVNTLTDSTANNDEAYPDNENAENAVIKCKDGSQVTICGSGTLNINANGKNGIKSGATTEAEGEASLTLRETRLNISASVNDAINAEQLLNIESGTLTISAQDDAIHSDLVLNIGVEGTTGPTINITGCEEGIEASTLNICSGSINVTSSDDCLNAANSDLTGQSFSITISGGTINAYSASGDGFDSNGSLTISGGTVAVWTASTADNQPLDADGAVTISGGTVLAAGGSGGMGMKLSASQPYVSFGSAGGMGRGQLSGGAGDRQPGGMDGQQPDDMGSRQPGGMNGQKPDGMDGRQPGGMNGQKPDGMGGQQPGGVNGQQPGDMGGSQQSAGTSISVPANSALSIQDASGNSVYSGITACKTGYVFFSSSALTSGGSYTLYSGSESMASATAQTGASAGQSGSGQRPDSETSTPQGFTDVSDSDWFCEAVRYVKDAGLMSGTSATSFSPGATTTRGMIVVILYRLTGSPDVSSANTFADVGSGAYCANAVEWASANNIAGGYGNGNFGPNDAVTREQLAAILYRYAQYMGYDVSNQGDLSGFKDNEQISSYAETALAWANAAGMISGTSSATLSPKGNATRAQTAAILMRFCQNVVQQ